MAEKVSLEIVGSTGLKQWSGSIYEEFHPKLQGQLAAKVYREMSENDAVIGAVLYLIEALFRQLEFRVEPADESEEAADEAAFLETCIEDMSHTWSDFMSEILSELVYGWALFEVVYKVRGGETEDATRRSAFNDGRIGWRKIAIRAQDTLDRWEFQDDGGLVGMWQMAPPRYDRVFIPIDKSLLFRTRSRKNNPEGVSMLRSSYRSWWFLKRLQELEAIGAERDLAGLPVLEVPPHLMQSDATSAQKALRASLERLIQQIRRDEREGVIIPSELDQDGKPTGYKLKLLSSGGGKAYPINEIIKRYQGDISRTFLADFMMLGQGSVGSFALASSKTNTFAIALGALRDSVLETINRFAVPKLMKANGIRSELWPSITAGDFDQQPLDEIGAYVSQLVSAGALTIDDAVERRLRELGSLPQLEMDSLPRAEAADAQDQANAGADE